jgi:mono/diheme cytochrome c family protein
MTRMLKFAIAACALITLGSAARALDLDAGKKIYVENCQKCHGGKGQGGIGMKLEGDSAYWDAEAFKKAVLEGVDDEGKALKPVMPRWGKTGLLVPKGQMLSDDDLANIQAFLKTLGPQNKSAE